jgi:hypothetical protein
MIVQDSQRFMAERMKATICSRPVDHTPMVTAPAIVLDIIHEAIAALDGPAGHRGGLSDLTASLAEETKP